MPEPCDHRKLGVGQIPFRDRVVHNVCLDCGEDLGPVVREAVMLYENGPCSPPTGIVEGQTTVTVPEARLQELKQEAPRWHPMLRAVIETYP
ncbi:MAG TPA: hypothetical protein VF747_02845 [Blastocatellia bacterium]|jgi:hypothetical protein